MWSPREQHYACKGEHQQSSCSWSHLLTLAPDAVPLGCVVSFQSFKTGKLYDRDGHRTTSPSIVFHFVKDDVC